MTHENLVMFKSKLRTLKIIKTMKEPLSDKIIQEKVEFYIIHELILENIASN